jgi:hypothetical protein
VHNLAIIRKCRKDLFGKNAGVADSEYRDASSGLGPPDHRRLAEALRRHVLEHRSETDCALRQAAAARAAGGPPTDSPYDSLAYQIGVAAHRVTDEQVARVVEVIGGQRAAFELIIAAAVGAGLCRWQAGLRALAEATDEAQ